MCFVCIYSTFRKGCQAEIKLRASEDGSHLVVTSVNTDHNHELKKVQYLLIVEYVKIYSISNQLSTP